MIAHAYAPRAPLSNFVELLWFQQRDTVAPLVEAALPEGTVEFVIIESYKRKFTVSA